MDLASVQALVDSAKRAFSLRDADGIPWAPKWHMFLHLCQRAHVSGNPRFHNTFLDEDYNGRLARLAATCHKKTWYTRVLTHFRVAFSDAGGRAKRPKT